MRLAIALPLCSLLWVAACASLDGAPAPSGAAPPAIDQAFTLRPGEEAEVGDERVRVVFVSVLADSRCPRNVQCIQAGAATVRVQVAPAGQARTTVELRTVPPDSSASVGTFVVTLAELQPEPQAETPTRASDYRATLVLSRRR